MAQWRVVRDGPLEIAGGGGGGDFYQKKIPARETCLKKIPASRYA